MALDEKTLESRIAVIRQLVERYEELVDPLTQNGEKGNGDQPPQMPTTYTASVREVERLLIKMRTEARFLWWHVTERYLRSSSTTRDVWVKRKLPSGRAVSEERRLVVTRVHPHVIDPFVNEGLQWMAKEWSLRSEPMLPKACLVSPPSQEEAAS